MKSNLSLKLKGEITPLTSNEESQLKGGFGVIDILDVKTNWGNTNTNCSNNGSIDANTNCRPCTCGTTSPGTGPTPATW